MVNSIFFLGCPRDDIIGKNCLAISNCRSDFAFKVHNSVLYLGHLGNIELAGGSIALGFANIITGYSVIKGLAKVMEPICSQACGAKKWRVLTQTFKQTLCLTTIPVTLLWLSMEPILLTFGKDKAISSVAKEFITYSIPDLLAQTLLHPLRIFVRAQSLTSPLMLSATCAMILHLPINYFSLIYLDWGVKGVVLASACHTLNSSLALIVHVYFFKTTAKPWEGPVVIKPYRVWQPLLKLMIPSVFSVCLEWLWYEIMVLLCGLIHNPQATVAAMGIVIQNAGLIYVFPSSLSSSLTTRVGQELGAGEPAKARSTNFRGLTVGIACGLLAFTLTIDIKDVWANLYTSEPNVAALTAAVLPILGLCELGNCPQTALNMGFRGLWFRLAGAQASCMAMMIGTLFFIDWNQEVERAKELAKDVEEPQNDLEIEFLQFLNHSSL